MAENEDTPPRDRFPAGRWALWVPLALVLYVLSVGPMGALVQRYYREHPGMNHPWWGRALTVFYTPLGVVTDNARWADRALVKYADWCSHELDALMPKRKRTK